MNQMLFDVLGWIGAFLLLVAYGAVSFGRLKADSAAYQYLNIVASVLLLANTLFYGAYPSSFVNGVWTVIALVAIVSIFRKPKRGIET
jgi:hypothetical protein